MMSIVHTSFYTLIFIFFLFLRSLQRNHLWRLRANIFFKYQSLQKLWVSHELLITCYSSIYHLYFMMIFSHFSFMSFLKRTLQYILILECYDHKSGSIPFIQWGIMPSWRRRAEKKSSLWVINTANEFHYYKADMYKAKRTAGNADRTDCSLLHTDPFSPDLSTSHSTTDCVCRRKRSDQPPGTIWLRHTVSPQSPLRLFDRIENFPEICVNKRPSDLPSV